MSHILKTSAHRLWDSRTCLRPWDSSIDIINMITKARPNQKLGPRRSFWLAPWCLGRKLFLPLANSPKLALPLMDVNTLWTIISWVEWNNLTYKFTNWWISQSKIGIMSYVIVKRISSKLWGPITFVNSTLFVIPRGWTLYTMYELMWL